jgi:CubicO group peptidase (beta-lactamase class C family)
MELLMKRFWFGQRFTLVIGICILMQEGFSIYSVEGYKSEFSESIIHSLDSLIDRYDLLGGTIVSFNDQSIKQYSFGKASLEQNIRWSDSTYFRIASISKFITAIAIMQLMEKGKYNLNTDISTLLDVPFRNSAFPHTPITIRMLLNHTSTIRDSDGAFEFAKRSIYIDTVNKDTLIPSINRLFTQNYLKKETFLPKTITLKSGDIVTTVPGTFFNYTNLNFVILAWIIEKVSGMSYAEYVQQHIFKPLNIKAGFLLQDIPKNSVIATQYRYSNMKWVPEGDFFTKQYVLVYKPIDTYVPGHNPFRFSPQAGLRIKARDLAILVRMFLSTNSLLTSESSDLMLTETWKNDGHNSKLQFNDVFQSWGLGLQILTNTPKKDKINNLELHYIGHIGRANGAYSTMFFDKNTHKGFIIFLNGIKSLPKGDHGFLQCEKDIISLIHQ